jgi:ribosome biogenesis GTPase / thiamine phosphate phosphatase
MAKGRGQPPLPRPVSADQRSGLVVAVFATHCWVEHGEGERTLCRAKGKKNMPVVGDRVRWQTTEDEGVVVQIDPRRNVFYRQDEWRTKVFAANIDQIVMMLAAEPDFSEYQLTKALIAAQAAGIAVQILLNKSDLRDKHAQAWQKLSAYRAMGHAVLPLAVHEVADADGWQRVLDVLGNKVSLVLGPSGVGKSSLINRLVPTAKAATAEISQALQSGKHTTTTSLWYWLETDCDPAPDVGPGAPHQQRAAIIDSPGFQEFGLRHIQARDLAALMPDFKPLLGGCRFYNCTHRQEPGCAISAAVSPATTSSAPPSAAATDPRIDPRIDPRRYALYLQLFEELDQVSY